MKRRPFEQSLVGKELFEITPVILGGSPTDPKNKALLDRKQHIEAVRYWNQIIAGLRQQQQNTDNR